MSEPIVPVLLVVAKAPVPGLAKTRLARHVGPERAADVAAAALLDTLDAVWAAHEAEGWPVVVAMTGDLDLAARSGEVRDALDRVPVVAQRGDDLGERLAHAHVDAAEVAGLGDGVCAGSGLVGTVQVGMDTPQVTEADLLAAGAAVRSGARVLGPALDGGWWLLGLPDPTAASVLVDVPMSRDDTGERTLEALGDGVHLLRTLDDVDEWDDARRVAGDLPGSRFAEAVAACAEVVA
jgi:glycosyltransferase A (GT-A) superfamily protein (DUF2064 family)